MGCSENRTAWTRATRAPRAAFRSAKSQPCPSNIFQTPHPPARVNDAPKHSGHVEVEAEKR
eukprot:413451-Rhodomonas_salina.1